MREPPPHTTTQLYYGKEGVPMKRLAKSLLPAILAALLLPAEGAAQTATGDLRGTVHDESGAVIPGATVTITSKSTGVARHAVSDPTGSYTVSNLNPGEYDVKAEMTGFQS